MAAGSIKSIQSGTISFDPHAVASGTATITSVNTAKAVVMNLGVCQTYASDTSYNSPGYLTLTNATTVTAQIIGTYGSGTRSLTASFQVVEYY